MVRSTTRDPNQIAEYLAESLSDVGATADAYTENDPLVVVRRGEGVSDDRIVNKAARNGFKVFACDAFEFTFVHKETYDAKIEAAT